MSIEKKRDRWQSTSVPFFSNYSKTRPPILFSHVISMHPGATPQFQFLSDNGTFLFFFLFMSSQSPHRVNFLFSSDLLAQDKLCEKTKPVAGLKAPLSATQVTPWGKVVEMKKRQPLVSHIDSTHDPWLSVTFRSLLPLGRSFPASLRSASGHICLAPLASWFYKHLAFEQSNTFGVSVPFRVHLFLAFFTFHTQWYQIESVTDTYKEIVDVQES